MNSFCKKMLMFGLVGLLGLLEAQAAHAAVTRKPSAKQERFIQLLAARRSGAQVRVATNRAQVSRNIAAFNRMVERQGPTPPRIPRSLLVQPRPNRVALLAAARQRKILALYRVRALRRGGVAGGVFFTPPAGTPYYPVSPANIFNYFPVYRA